LFKRALTELGKSLLIVAGVGYGMAKAFDILGQGRETHFPNHLTAPNPPHVPEPASERPMTSDRHTAPVAPGYSASARVSEERASSRLEQVEERLIRMEKRIEVLIAPLERLTSPPAGINNFVTKAELNSAMEQFSRRLEEDTERRFEVQDRSVQSLRTMMARTDELLEQVIENIESLRITA
jgi:hypothetical protein